MPCTIQCLRSGALLLGRSGAYWGPAAIARLLRPLPGSDGKLLDLHNVVVHPDEGHKVMFGTPLPLYPSGPCACTPGTAGQMSVFSYNIVAVSKGVPGKSRGEVHRGCIFGRQARAVTQRMLLTRRMHSAVCHLQRV